MEMDKRFSGVWTDMEKVRSLLFERGYTEEKTNYILRLNGVSEKDLQSQIRVENICKMEGHEFYPEREFCARCGFPKSQLEESS